MAMNANALKANLKTDLILIFNTCNAGSGISPEDYADMISEAIASRVVEHITGNAAVNTTVTGTTTVAGTAGTYPIAGAGTGKVS
jgi:hypothetical protein